MDGLPIFVVMFLRVWCAMYYLSLLVVMKANKLSFVCVLTYLGVDCKEKTIEVDGKLIKLQIW